MEITRNEESRIISVWLTNADQQNEEIQNWLKGKYPVWKKEDYLTVVYKSGHEDLYENTLALLKHNRRLSAQKEVEAEKRAWKQAEAERLAGKQPVAEMSTSAQPAAQMRAGTQGAADQAAKPSILEKLGKKPPQVQGRAKQRTRKHSEDPLPPPICLLLKRRKPPQLRSWSRGVHLIISMRTYTFTSGFFSPNFSLSVWQISLRALPCFSMLLIVL